MLGEKIDQEEFTTRFNPGKQGVNQKEQEECALENFRKSLLANLGALLEQEQRDVFQTVRDTFFTAMEITNVLTDGGKLPKN